uniref:Uncharacterized protein n=1 Tax=Aegilops tauschii subsp. strangulata TaxID=200361 RepID=A0A453EHP8_AEGTS
AAAMAMVPAVPVLLPRADAGRQLRHPLGPRRHRRPGRHPQIRQLPPPPRQEPRDLRPDKDKEFKIDWKRVGITSSFGFAFVGPVGHYWYEYLDRMVRRRYLPGSFKFVASKVAADGLLFGPLDLGLFFSYVGLASGRSLEQVKDDVKRDIIPALVLGGAIWPAVQIANFRFIPVRYQLLYVNLFCLLDSCFLSWIEQQGDAAWKQWFTSFQKKIEDQKSNA